MNPTLAINGDRAESEEHIQQLSERIAELERNNMLLEEVLCRNTRMVVKGLTGIDADVLIGKPIDSLAVPDDREIISDAYRQLLQGRSGRIRIAVRVPRADGTIVLHTAVLTDMLDDPNVQGIVWNYSTHPFLE